MVRARIRKVAWVVLPLAAAAAVATAGPASGASAAPAHPSARVVHTQDARPGILAAADATHCSSGSRWIEAYNGTSGLYIHGNGRGSTVDITPSGNCFHNVASTYDHAAILLENGSGNCLNVRNSDGLITLAGCDPSSDQQSFEQFARNGGTIFLEDDLVWNGWMNAEAETEFALINSLGPGQVCSANSCTWLGVP